MNADAQVFLAVPENNLHIFQKKKEIKKQEDLLSL
jgi:hypothetical protein